MVVRTCSSVIPLTGNTISGNQGDGVQCMNRCEVVIEENQISTAGFQGSVTASLGVGTLVEGVSSIYELLKIADRAVYAAKNKGRNQSIAGDPPEADRKSA